MCGVGSDGGGGCPLAHFTYYSLTRSAACFSAGPPRPGGFGLPLGVLRLHHVAVELGDRGDESLRKSSRVCDFAGSESSGSNSYRRHGAIEEQSGSRAKRESHGIDQIE